MTDKRMTGSLYSQETVARLEKEIERLGRELEVAKSRTGEVLLRSVRIQNERDTVLTEVDAALEEIERLRLLNPAGISVTALAQVSERLQRERDEAVAALAKAREERDAANSALTLRANEIRGLVEEADKERSEWSAAVLSNLAVLGVPTLCAWCGIPASGADEIRAHVADCKSNHAVSRALAAERARDEAVAEVARLKEALGAAQTALGDAHYWFKRAAGGPRADYTMECRTGEAEYAARRAMAGEGA